MFIYYLFAKMYWRLFCFLFYFVTIETKYVSQQSDDFWNEAEPFRKSSKPSPDLRLPSIITPSFYRLKIKADLETSTFTGEVLITIRASKKTTEIILHSKNLSINENVTLTEQTYQNVPTSKFKREINATDIVATTEPTDSTVVNYNGTVSTVSIPTSEVNNVTLENDTIIPTLPSNAETTATTNVPVLETTMTSVKEVTLSNVRDIKLKNMEFSTGDRLILHLETPLTPNVDYTLHMAFHGEILNTLTGFYKSTYKEDNVDKQFGVTQFEPTSARAAFPCFDEPAFKAKFEISIAHRQNISVLSNMKIAAQEPIDSEPGWQWTHFDRSVQMSTYLVAYVLSDFKHLETSYISKDNVTKPIRVWARPSLIKNAKYALSIIPKILAFYEDVFGLPYALDKVDLVAIPDFSNGAMENWGLITFRETTLLYDEKEGVPRLKQHVAIDVAHELAHQWFGNLVTMKWWTDLWLNEGFATYIEYVGVNHITPEWNILESLTRDKMNLLKNDALKNTSPVSRQVVDASEISQKFDEISYNKGANLIRMLNHTISYELFRDALLLYLKKWKYQNAEENDLWDAMSEATKSDPSLKGLSVKEFMNSWTRQPGYPVVNVNRDYDTGYVTFQQELFRNSPELSKNKDLKWRIPISYTTMDVPTGNWSTKPKLWLNEKTLRPLLPVNQTQALYVNVDAIGYYRVNYDQRNWELLNAALESKTISSPITKAQLIDDAFNLAKAGRLNYSYALGLTTCVIDGEDSKIVWETLLDNIYYLMSNLRATSGYIYFQDYMKLLLKKQLEKVNYGLDKPKNDNEAFLIENLVVSECLVESSRCIKWTKDEFEKLIANPDSTDLPNYLRSLVYNMAIKHGGRREFELLWDLYLNATEPNTQHTILSNLPATRVESLITLLLEKSLTDIPNQSASILWAVDPPVGTKIAQEFLMERFDQVYEKFTKIDTFMFPIVLNSAFGNIATNADLDKLKRFALQNKEKLMPMSQTLQKIIDSAVLRINWIKKYSAGINEWLKQYVTENATHNHTNTTPAPTLTQNITINITPSTSPTSSPLLDI
ncbi:aminopeptidase N-like isoform X2 [Pararge aegeria]|uniref:aminopeptidase N-like isoform X2 n=1 Tax=Pararge aegeria TaxID=116150 RepID=UPI0019D2436B|nr:aminopeptidase N-like isoform X2 [Pararge aegeria]